MVSAKCTGTGPDRTRNSGRVLVGIENAFVVKRSQCLPSLHHLMIFFGRYRERFSMKIISMPTVFIPTLVSIKIISMPTVFIPTLVSIKIKKIGMEIGNPFNVVLNLKI